MFRSKQNAQRNRELTRKNTVKKGEGLRQIHGNIRHYKENARVLMDALDECGIRYWGGKNAPYIWMACPDGMKSWDFFALLLNEIQVVGTPGRMKKLLKRG